MADSKWGVYWNLFSQTTGKVRAIKTPWLGLALCPGGHSKCWGIGHWTYGLLLYCPWALFIVLDLRKRGTK